MSSCKPGPVSLCQTVCCLAIVAAIFTLPFSSAAQAQTYTVLHSFTGATDGYNPTGLAIDQSGNLYGASTDLPYEQGGDGLIFKMANRHSAWTFAPLHIFIGDSGSNLDGKYPNGVVIGPDHNLYGTTLNGGYPFHEVSYGTVFSLAPPVSPCPSPLCFWPETAIHLFTPGNDGIWPQSSDLAFDQGGNIYGATPQGGNGPCFEYGCGTVYQLSKVQGSWSETVLYQFNQGDTDYGPLGGVVLDDAGNLYGVDQGGSGGCGTVFELQSLNGVWSKQTLFTFDCGTNGANPEATLLRDSSGNLYGSTTSKGAGDGGTVFELSPSGGGLWNFALLYSFTGPERGPHQGLTLDATGNLYGATNGDGLYGYGNVFKLTPSNGSWIYTSLYDFTGGSDGAYPSSKILMDAQGNLYGSAGFGGNSNCIDGCGVVFKITP